MNNRFVKNALTKFTTFLAVACVLCSFPLFTSDVYCQETDFELVAKRLGKMVKKEQLTQAQADVMLSALKKSIAKETGSGSIVAQPKNTWQAFEKPKSANNKDVSPSAKAKMLMQDDIDQLKKLVAAGEMTEEEANRKIEQMENLWVQSEEDRKQFAVESTMAKLKSSLQSTREERIKSAVQLKQMNTELKKYDTDIAKAKTDLDKLKQLLEDAEPTGSINRNGREITSEMLKSLAESTMNKISTLKNKKAKEQELIAITEKNHAAYHAACIELEDKFTERLKELEVRQAKEKVNQAAKELQQRQLDVQKSLEDLDREIDKKIEELNNSDPIK